jgi:hypothetical protein
MIKDIKNVSHQTEHCSGSQLSIRFIVNRAEFEGAVVDGQVNAAAFEAAEIRAGLIAAKVHDKCLAFGKPENLPFLRVPSDTPDSWHQPYEFCEFEGAVSHLNDIPVFDVTLANPFGGPFQLAEITAFRNFVFGMMIATEHVEQDSGATVEFHDIQQHIEYRVTLKQTIDLTRE